MVYVLLSAGVVAVALLLLFVYAVRLSLRVVCLWASVVFYQADGTHGDCLSLAAKMFSYVVRGKR
jgi:hypothetical protein